MTKRLFSFVAIVTVAFSAAYYFKKNTNLNDQISRDLASKGYARGEVPQGLKDLDEASFNHLSEGSEVYPYEWLMALKEVSPDGKSSSPFLEGLDHKFNFVADQRASPYLLPYVGMTTAWSSHPPQQSDATTADADQSVRVLNGGVRSIKMVGVNCAACHTSEIRFEGHAYRVDGAPNLINIRNFFKELGKSTITLFIKKQSMIDFLRSQNVPNPEERATELCGYFFKTFDDATGFFGGNSETKRFLRSAFYKIVGDIFNLQDGELGSFVTVGEAKHKKFGRLYRGRDAMARSLEKLLRVTYGFGENDEIGELKQRMNFLGMLFVGNPPQMKETIAGYGRTDAFGRISNLSLRGERPVDNTAPVSLPSIWSLKYTAMLHYTANSNSVVMRNVGQSLGLGSLVLNKSTSESTTNMHNLERLEKLAYQIKVPQWENMFKNVPKLKPVYELTERGKVVYQQNCMNCHTPETQKVGPTRQLNLYKMYGLNEIGTDPTAAKNIVTPVDGLKFKDSIFQAMTKIKSAYYIKNKISSEEQAVWEARATRGPEFFRDTFLGENDTLNGAEYAKIQAGMGYRARHLAGVWATAPYLHNGSVPTMTDLLKPASQRPKLFKVGSRELDPVNLGVHTETTESKCDVDDESCFDTTLVGNYNIGHEYGTGLSQSDKTALIEYLKVLPPEPDYSW